MPNAILILIDERAVPTTLAYPTTTHESITKKNELESRKIWTRKRPTEFKFLGSPVHESGKSRCIQPYNASGEAISKI